MSQGYARYKSRFWLFFEAIFKAKSVPYSPVRPGLYFWENRYFQAVFAGVFFWGEKCPLSAGRVAFVILEVTQVTERSVLPNRALFTGLIEVNIGFVCRCCRQEFIGQSDLNRYGLVVHIRKDKY